MRARLIVVMILVLLLTACGDDDGLFPGSTADGSTTATTAEGETTTSTSVVLPGESSTTTGAVTTTTGGPPVASVWERVPGENVPYGPGRQGMAGVTAGGPGLVAVGWDLSSGESDASVWTSADGVVWQQVVIGEAGNQYANAVVAGGPGLVAVGYESGADDDAAVWTSPDGVAWTRVPHDEEIFGGPGGEQMFGVAAGGPGLVAVGWGGSGDDDGAAVWVSTDGFTWERIVDDAVLSGPGGQGMFGVVAGGPGLVAVGYDSSGEWDAAVWTSADGRTWSRVPPDAAVFGGPNIQQMNAVTVGGPGLVAVGADYAEVAPNAVVWTSRDGVIWTRVPHDAAIFGGPGSQEMLGVASGSPGLVAVGRDDTGEAGDAAAWTSADGLTWARVVEPTLFGGPLMQEMRAVGAGGPGLVAVGLELRTGGGEQHAVVWLNRPTG